MTTQTKQSVVRGAGGKGGGGGGEAADTLRSTQRAETLDLVGEGEFEGLTNGFRSIYLDGVPLQNADGTFNFEGVQVSFTPGTQGQAAITGADGVQSEVGVGVEVLAGAPVVRTISNPSIDKVRVTIAVPQLSETNTSNGSTTGSSFDYAIDVQSAGGGYVTVVQDTVAGKSTSRYTRSKVFALPGIAPWDVRLRRVSADAVGSYVVNKFAWASYTEIQSLKLRHPNSALVRLRLGAEQFSRIPVRSFDVMAARVQVPTNYNTLTKAYTGIWDGNFKIAWTDCPAWVYYAVLTNRRYGLGRYFSTGDAVKWDLYRIGQYCDQMVSDGKGGLEPRFRCGVNLSTREQAYKVLADLAGIFRGMGYWANTDVSVVQDAPSDPVALYTAANVVDGKFTYTGASRSKRHTQVTVWFNDLQQNGKLVPEVVVGRALERRYGVKPMELSPLGVWSRAQAHRLGLWALYSEQHEGAAISFRVGLDGVLTPPGKTFLAADPNEAGERLGGRVRAATTSQVTLDNDVTLASGESYALSAMVQDPADPAKLVVQKRVVTTGAGLVGMLSVSPAFTSAPAAQSIWLLQSEAVQPTTWRCLTLAEVQGTNEFEISGLRHYPEKYALIEDGIAFEPPSVSRISAKPKKPTELLISEVVYAAGASTRSRATVSWREGAPGQRYQLAWRLALSPWTDLAATTANCVEVDGLLPGLFEVLVRGFNAIGSGSPPAKAELVLVGQQAPAVQLAASATIFAYDAAGAPKPATQTITFTATRTSLIGVPTIVATGYAANGTGGTPLTLSGSGDTRTLAVADLGAFAYARVVATLGGLTAQVTIGRVRDGQTATWVRVTGDNFNTNAAGFVGRGAVLSNGQATGGIGSGEHLVVYDPITETVISGPTAYFTYATGTAALAAAISSVAAGKLVLLYSTDATMCDGPLRAALAGCGGLPDLTWPAERRSHVFIGMRGLQPGEGYESTSVGADATGITSQQAYYSASGIVKNGAVGAAGAVGVDGLSNARVLIYQRSSTGAPALPSATATYTFATGVLSGLNNGWSATIPTGTAPVYASGGTAASAGPSDTIAPGEWAGAQLLADNGAAGADGLNNATVYLFQRTASATPPALPSATVTFTFSTGLASGVNNGWAQTMPTSGGPFRWMTTGTALSAAPTDGVAPSEWAAQSLLAQDGAPGVDGLSNARVLIYQRSSTGAPALPSATATYTFATGVLSGLNNGWSATIPGGTGPVYASSGTAASAGPSDTIAPGEWAGAQLLADNGTAGADGLNNATVYLFQRTASAAPPALPSATVIFTFSTGLASGVNNGWAQTMPTSGGPFRWMTTGTALSAAVADAIAPSEWAAQSLIAQDGEHGNDGQPGASAYLATVYQQAAEPPSAPSGGSFDFGSATLTPPSGLVTTQPSNSVTLNTYAFTYSFGTPAPGATVTAGTWAGPAVVYQAPALQTGIVSPGPAVSVGRGGNGASTITARIAFTPSGVINRIAVGTTAAGKWHIGAPPSTFYMRTRVTQGPNGGPTLSGLSSAGQALTGTITVTLTAAAGQVGDARVGYEISADSGFGAIVSYGELSFAIDNAP